MACTRIDTSFGHIILCDFCHASRCFKVQGRKIFMEYHRYLGPRFTTVDGQDYFPEGDDIDDELWDKFGRWVERYEKRKPTNHTLAEEEK